MNFEAHQRLGDEELIILVQRKDMRALEVLYDRHAGAAYSLALRIVGEQHAAEDATQDAFLSVWRSKSSFDAGRGSVRSWLLGIVRNRAIDLLRRTTVARARLDLDDEAAMDAQPAAEETDEEAIRRERSSRVRQALRGLPDEQSQVIWLAYFGGFTHSEIAEMLGAPLGTVKGRMRLGLAKIQSQLAEAI